MEKKKDKSIKKKEEKKKKKIGDKKTKRTQKKSASEKIRGVIKGKKSLTRNQILQFLSGVIDGTIKDDITKFEANTQDKLKAAQIMLGEYQQEREENEKSKIENETQKTLDKVDDNTENLISLLIQRQIEGFNVSSVKNIEDIEDAIQPKDT